MGLTWTVSVELHLGNELQIVWNLTMPSILEFIFQNCCQILYIGLYLISIFCF